MDGYPEEVSYLTHIRGVALLPGERITHVFSPSWGLSEEPPVDGQLLITTDQRILAFSQEDGRDQTHMVPVEELKGVTVKSGARNAGSLFQGLALVVGGLFIYLIVSYWVTGRFNVSVPIIRMDFGAVIVLLAVIAGGILIGKYYLAKEGGSVTFQGSNWVFTFPFKSDRSRIQVYRMVNTVFVARRSLNGFHLKPGEAPGPAFPTVTTSFTAEITKDTEKSDQT